MTKGLSNFDFIITC